MARKTGSTGAETAEALRRAALRLFARHGYAAVSMRAIATEVGVQPGALYNHVATKQDLLRDLMIAHMHALMDAWAEAPRPRDPVEALRAFTRFHLRWHLPRAEAVFVSYMELRNLEPANFAEIEALRRGYEAELRAILARGAEAGVFHAPQPAVAARAIIAMLTGVTGWYRPDGPLTAAAIERIYTDMALGAVAPRGAATEREDRACSTPA